MRRIALLSSVALFLALVSPAVQAGTIYSTFGPEDSFGAGGWAVFGSDTGFPGNVAAPFTPTSTETLASIDLVLGMFAGAPQIVVMLQEEAGGLPKTGDEFESWTVTVTSFAGSVYRLDSLNKPALSAGTQYWVAAYPGDDDTQGGWYMNDQGFLGVAADQGAGWWISGDQDTPAFRVNSVPLPAAAWLGLSLLALMEAARRLRRRK